jgi:hypothetical protein
MAGEAQRKAVVHMAGEDTHPVRRPRHLRKCNFEKKAPPKTAGRK